MKGKEEEWGKFVQCGSVLLLWVAYLEASVLSDSHDHLAGVHACPRHLACHHLPFYIIYKYIYT